MAPDSTIMQAVEALEYRVTPGDVASQVGIDIKLAEQGLLVLASEAGGHLQVSESGEIAYLFPPNFRTVLRSKYFQLRLQEWWSRIWTVLFYLIRISFGILLIASIVLIIVTITILLMAMNSSRDNDDDRGGGGGGGGGIFLMPRMWFGPDLYWMFYPDYSTRRSERRRPSRDGSAPQMNFLEAVFSFLFGDGNPNADLEERRWKAIARVIRNNKGAIAAEQIAPYLDTLGSGFDQEYEDYMLPVLTRFNGRPEVSPDGQIIYHFPELQVMASEYQSKPVPAYLKEAPWRFSEAGSGQLTLAAGLGVLNLGGAIALGWLLGDGTLAAEIGGLVAFVSAIFWVLLGYGAAFLAVPLVRYLWLKQRNAKVEKRNNQRAERAELLNQADETIVKKLDYARQFAAETVIDASDLAYTTEKDLTEQELLRSDKIDEEWRQRLEGSSSS
ncbi:MAG TPA: hypothetical protein V6C88_08665 [Chroococcidiopsis sp.]